MEPLDGRKQFEGVLIGLDGETVQIDVAKMGTVAIPFDQIANAKLLLTDALIAATAPLSSDGADKIAVEG